jgi:hypothetical protein
MMPRLVDLWRREWSKVPNTTDPLFPFGLVTLSTSDSESAGDIGSFRFAQTGSWGVLPNPDMPRTWTAQACKYNPTLTETSPYPRQRA